MSLIPLENTWTRGFVFRSITLNENLCQNLPRAWDTLRQFKSFYSYVSSCSDWHALTVHPILFAAAKLNLLSKTTGSFVSGMTPVNPTATSNRFHQWIVILQIYISGWTFFTVVCPMKVNWGYIFASFAGKFENGVAEGTVDPSLNPISSFRLSVIQNSAVWAILNEVRGGITFEK